MNKKPRPRLMLLRGAPSVLLLACPLLASSNPTTHAQAATAAAPSLAWRQLPPLPEPVGLAGPFASTSGGALIVAGGANIAGKDNFAGAPKVWYDRTFLLEKSDEQWRAVGECQRSGAGCLHVAA